MRDIGEGTIRRIDWQELTPVVLLLRVFNTATGFRVLFLSVLGILATILVGCLINSDGLRNPRTSTILTTPAYLEPLVGVDGAFRDSGRSIDVPDLSAPEGAFPQPAPLNDFCRDVSAAEFPSFRKDPAAYVWRLAQRSVFVPWDLFSVAGFRFFSISSPGWGSRVVTFAWLGLLLVIWTFFGGMICRTVALRLAVDEAESPSQLWRFMKTRGLGFLSSMTAVLLGILFCLIPIWIAGLLFPIPVFDYLVAICFPIPLLFGLFAIVLAFGLLVGWPLLFAAVAVEGTDGFDAVSRMFSYVYQRLFHYFFYWIVAGILGILGFVLVSVFVDGIVFLTVGFGRFPAQTAIASFGGLTLPATTAGLTGAGNLVLAWCALIQLLKTAYVFAWFWTTAVAIYLLLRRSVDATPFGEVYRPQFDGTEAKSLPEITVDEHGAPEIVEQ